MTNIISTMGTDNTFVSLHFARQGDKIHLKAIATEWVGAYGYTDVGEVVVDEEDAVNAACDLEWDAAEFLGIRDAYKDNPAFRKDQGFGEAVEKVLDEVSA